MSADEGDPIPIADDVCEVLHAAGWEARAAELSGMLESAGGLCDGVIAEVARRGLLERLLPASASTENARLLGAIVDGASGEDALGLLAQVLLARGGEYDRVAMNDLVLRAEEASRLPPWFARIVAAGQYERLIGMLTADGRVDSPALRALAAARPTYDVEALNALAVSAARARTVAGTFAYDVLIVPGFTPLSAGAPEPLATIPAAGARLSLAAADFASGRAPFVLVSGGSVHPPGTPLNEALMMRDELLGRGLPAERLLVDPFARHSTTNLRNAGRLMRALGLSRGLIVTGYDQPVFSQAFYFAHPALSTFNARCEEELGYVVGDLAEVDDHHVAFTPSDAVDTPAWTDPLDA